MEQPQPGTPAIGEPSTTPTTNPPEAVPPLRTEAPEPQPAASRRTMPGGRSVKGPGLMTVLLAGLIVLGLANVAFASGLIQPRGTAHMASDQTNGTLHLAPSSMTAAAPVVNDSTTAWAFILHATPPTNASPNGLITAVFANITGPDAPSEFSYPLELAGVQWDALQARPVQNATVLDVLNAALQQAPPLVYTNVTVGHTGDSAVLMVPAGANITSVLAYSPTTKDFIIYHWPTGQAYAWSNVVGWAPANTDYPYVLARPPLTTSAPSK